MKHTVELSYRGHDLSTERRSFLSREKQLQLSSMRYWSHQQRGKTRSHLLTRSGIQFPQRKEKATLSLQSTGIIRKGKKRARKEEM